MAGLCSEVTWVTRKRPADIISLGTGIREHRRETGVECVHLDVHGEMALMGMAEVTGLSEDSRAEDGHLGRAHRMAEGTGASTPAQSSWGGRWSRRESRACQGASHCRVPPSAWRGWCQVSPCRRSSVMWPMVGKSSLLWYLGTRQSPPGCLLKTPVFGLKNPKQLCGYRKQTSLRPSFRTPSWDWRTQTLSR